MKLVPGGLAVVVLVLLAGCGSDQVRSPQGATPTTASVTPAPGAHVIPAGFPLLAGLPLDSPVEGPDYGTRGPGRDLDPLVPGACDHDVALPPHVDLLRGGWSNVEDFRGRQLVTFADRASAAAYAREVVETFRDCPEDKWDDHLGTPRSSRARTWARAWAVSRQSTYDGSPMPGHSTWHVVLVDRHVLLSTTSDEGGPGADRDAAALAEVVRAMGVLGNTAARPWFGPDGYGEVRLGMTVEELQELPHLRVDASTADCRSFGVETAYAGLEPGVSGILEGGHVTSLALRAPSSTPEGIGPGASYDAVLAAYPGAGVTTTCSPSTCRAPLAAPTASSSARTASRASCWSPTTSTARARSAELSGAERVVLAATLRDLPVELGQASHQLAVVLGDRLRPVVAIDNRLVELLVQPLQIRPGALVDGVVELGQPDLLGRADLGAPGQQPPTRRLGHSLLLAMCYRIGPCERHEHRRRRIAKVTLQRRRLRPRPSAVCRESNTPIEKSSSSANTSVALLARTSESDHPIDIRFACPGRTANRGRGASAFLIAVRGSAKPTTFPGSSFCGWTRAPASPAPSPPRRRGDTAWPPQECATQSR